MTIKLFSICIVAANITQGPIDTPAMIGDNITFTCTATGIPLPTITWMDQDGNIVGTTSDMVINDTTIQSTLTLINLQVDDFRNYICLANNTFNGDTLTALLGSEYNTVSFLLMYLSWPVHMRYNIQPLM